MEYTHLLERVALVLVKAPLHADARSPFQSAEHQAPGVPVHCRRVKQSANPTWGQNQDLPGPPGLTSALGKVGDVLVVEHHLVLKHVGQSSEPRPAHDAHQGSNVCLSQ